LINVANDGEGVKQAVLELFEESLREPDLKRSLERLKPAMDEFETVVKFAGDRRLSPGYYTRAFYLIWLRGRLEVGVTFDLYADEADGLLALAAARGEFETNHPACCYCGARQLYKTARRCRACSKEFKS